MAIVAVAAAWITACGSPSPSATPSPTPVAIDVAETFADALLDPGFTATADISGSIAVGLTEGEISGSAELAGPDTFQELTFALPGVDTTSAVLTVDGETYSRTGDGPWVRQATPSSDSTLQGQFLALLADLRDEGVAEVDGRSLHHLVPSDEADLDAAAFGISDPTITDFTGMVDFYATPEGEPVVLRFTLTWTQADQDAEMVLQYDLNVRAEPQLAAPDEPWIAYTSSRFSYAIAYPEAWLANEFDATDEFRAYDAFYSLTGTPGIDGEVQVYLYPSEEVSPYSASDWFAGAGEILTTTFGVEVEFTEPITVAGIASRYFSLHYVQDEVETFFQEAVIYTTTRAWDVDWYSDAGDEEADRAAFDQFLTTFTPNP